MLTCKEVLDSISDYLDADMKADLVAEMRKHIGFSPTAVPNSTPSP